MSEYQYYEFQAVDRPLTDREQATLRGYSSRATITSNRFVVDYSWGSFKGNVAAWMENYFDAFLYLANWGTHELMLRLPRQALPLRAAKAYCVGEVASVRTKGDHIILTFRSDDEDGEWVDEDNTSLAALLPARSELASGDLRALYLAWLGGVQLGDLDDDDEEPLCPPGLGTLSAALEAFVDFMRIDRDLIAAAAAGSPELVASEEDALRRWVVAMPEAEKTALLVRLVSGAESHLRAELLRRFRAARPDPTARPKRRTVGQLRQAAEAHAEGRRRAEEARAARAQARRERAEAAARERALTALAAREADAWHEVDALLATKQPRRYDEATALLCDLREVCVRDGRAAEAATRLARLCAAHAKKPSLIERFRKAGLLT
jgi:hypothetical protein